MKRKNLLKSLAALSLVGVFILASGCQTSGSVVATEDSGLCPTCKNETTTKSIKGLTYTKHVCPSCKTVVDTGKTPNYDELGDFGNEIHVCTRCKASLITCPQCASKK